MNIILITFFVLASAFSLFIKVVIFHHFKKFSLPGDHVPMKVLSIFKKGSIILMFFTFVFLIILFI